MGNVHVDVEHGGNDFIEETAKSILHCVKKANQNNRERSSSINRVHNSLRGLSPRSFSPRVVSIGPLHHGKNKNVQAFEWQKARYLNSLLSRLKFKFPDQEEKILEECVKKVKDKIDQIKACYEGIDDYGTDTKFVKMMVMDACFILEFVYQIVEPTTDEMPQLQAQSACYDLLLLENQIPFFVLNDIFQCTIFKVDTGETVIQFICQLLTSVSLFNTKLRVSHISNDSMPHHILALLHTCYKPQISEKNTSKFSDLAMHSAVELDRAGVNFKPYPDAKWAMAMKVELYRFPWYWRKPTLRMPVLRIHHCTESVLRNLIAYEQSSQGDNYITSYAMAMDMLVNTQEDIAKLVQSKVLVVNMSSNEEAANMMNKVCKDVPWEHFVYGKEWKQLDTYYNHCLPNNIAHFKRTYFSSPWNIVALLAGIVLFALTVVQTFFTVKSAN